MSQHDFTIANQTASSARSDINNALQALVSNNSGASAPSTTYANMFWYDTALNLLKVRNEGDSAWINVAYVNQSTNKFEILDDTKVVTTSGSQTGLLGDQATNTWETGTGTTESLVSPAKVLAAIGANSISETARNITGAAGSEAGYLTLSNGFIFQWDNWNYSHGYRNFPIAFPNACLGFSYTQRSGWYENWNGYKVSASQYYSSNVYAGENASRATYQAMFSIGY